MPVPHKFRFVEEADIVKQLVENEYIKIASQIEVPGFRKGHVPRNVAEKQKWFNRFQMYKGVFDELYIKALESSEMQVIDATDFEVMGVFDDNSPLVIQATVYLKPKVNEFDIKKIKVQKIRTEVTDEMIDEQIKIEIKQSAKFTNVIDENYKIKNGDLLIIDYTGRIDGKEFPGGSAKFYKYIVGETQFINGFEQQLVNLKLNETNLIKVTFPEKYHAAELRRKEAEFTTTITKIESCELKTIDDFVKEKEKTIDEYKHSIRERLIEQYKKLDEQKFETNILSAAVASADIEPIPEKMIDWELNSEWNKLLYRIGMTEEEYLKRDSKAKENFLAQRRAHAQKAVEVRIFLDYVCDELYKVDVSKDEVINYLKSQGEKLQKSEEEMKEILKNIEKENNYKATENTIKHDKVLIKLIQEVERNLDAETKT